MNILLAISETPPLRSGIARIAERLRAGFAAAGHRVEVLSTNDTGRLSLGEVRLTGLLPRWPALRRRAAGADIVAVFGPAPTFSDALLLLLGLRRRGGEQRIVYTHVFEIDLPFLSPLCALYRWAHRRLARLADRVVVATPGYAAGFPSDRLTVIPWGIDHPASDAPASEKDERFTVLFVGQLRPYKGVGTLIRAAAQVPEARVLIAGDGPQRGRLERQAERQGACNVTFLGYVSDGELAQLYRTSHVVVLPSVSRLEAFGLTLLEGMAAGCVPVASALPGVTDVVGDAGLTYLPGDADALARILIELGRDQDERRRRSELARERSRQYSWERTVDSYLALFQALAEESGAHNSKTAESLESAEELQPALRGRP